MTPEPFNPFDYQRPMVRWLLDRDVSALFCSPSLGKTPVTLMALSEWMATGEMRGAVVIAPVRCASVTWPAQIRRWRHSSWMRFAHLRTREGMEAWKKGSADIYLVNPEQLPKLVPLMFGKGVKPPADCIVFDELSLAKNPSSVRFKTIRPHLPLFRKRIGLTGTPASNSYLDLFAQIRLLDDGKRLGRSYHQFRSTYFTSDFMGYKWTINPGAKEIIDAKLADLCLVMLGDDYLDVPDCRIEDVEVTLPPEGRKAYRTMEKELLLSLAKGDVVALTAATLAGKLLQITGGAVYDEDRVAHHIHDAKTEALVKLRQRHGTEPMLVVTAYRHEAASVLQSIPGSRMFDERDIPEWQAGRIHTWVCDPRSMSHGIDGLQLGGRIVVWRTLTYSFETWQQLNARIVRTNQKHETIIYRIMASDTIDWAVCEALGEKDRTQSGLLNALKTLQTMRTQ